MSSLFSRRVFFVLASVAALVCLSFPAGAAPTLSSSPAPSGEIVAYPIVPESSVTLDGVSLRISAARVELETARQQFQSTRQRLLNVSRAEYELVTAQVAETRRRYLQSYVNVQVAYFQRLYVIRKSTEKGLLVVRVRALQRGDSAATPRADAFESTLTRATPEENALISLIQEARNSPSEENLSRVNNGLSRYQETLASILSEYRILAQRAVKK